MVSWDPLGHFLAGHRGSKRPGDASKNRFGSVLGGYIGTSWLQNNILKRFCVQIAGRLKPTVFVAPESLSTRSDNTKNYGKTITINYKRISKMKFCSLVRKSCLRAPKEAPRCPGTPKHASQNLPYAAKTAPKRHKMTSSWLQDGPKTPQTAPRRPETRPRRPRIAPRRSQDALCIDFYKVLARFWKET